LAGVIGDKTIMLMANHGALTVGDTVAQAYDRLYYLERVAQVQIYAMWANRELNVLPDDVIEHTIAQYNNGPRYGNKSAAEHHFDALKRQLDRTQADYLD
jgi:ribulose-5-phosphate 4-epimerase/fuculose-1-phosphate aldolase